MCLFAATGCAADVGDSESAAEPGAVGTVDEALVKGDTSLPWRGAPQKNVMTAGNFAGSEIITQVNVGMSTVCVGRSNCLSAVSGLKLFLYNTLTGATSTTTVGKSTAGSWTQQLCPFNSYVDGYNLGVESPFVGKPPLIRKFGIHCQSVNRVGTNLPILGGGNVLFPEFLTCTPSTTSRLRYIDIVRMNQNGDGISADCTS